MMEFTIQQIAALVKGDVKGNGDEKISMLAKIQDAQKGHISFLSNPKYEPFIYTTQASAVIVKNDFSPRREITTSLILVEDPYLSFTVLLEEYHKRLNFQKVGVEQPSYLGEDSVIGAAIYRGAFSFIGNRVKIGANVKIYPHTYVGDGVTIGENTILHAGVKVYAGTQIGSNCEIHSGAVIGSSGFGFAPQPDGSYKAIPQLGTVIIQDNVSIGANTVLDCATLLGDATVVAEGAKLDNLIQIAHNVEIGRNTVIAAQTGISGSSKLGANCVIAGQVGIAGHLTIAADTKIGAQAGISKSIQEGGQRIIGYPAFDIKQYFRSYAVFKRLPEIIDRLRALEKRVENESATDRQPTTTRD